MSLTSSPAQRGPSLSLLPDFDLRAGDTHLAVAPTSQRLLVFVALHRRRLQRRYVSGAVWPEATDAHAQASLRSALWRLPTIDGRPLLASSATHIWIQPELDVDLHHAEEEARLLIHGDREQRMEDLDLLSDDLLREWCEDWVIVERERFRQLRLHALERACELFICSRQYSLALEVALTAVAGEPLRESANRLVVRVHLAEGNVAEAMRHYRGYADQLKHELGAEPTAALRRMLPREPAVDGGSTTAQ